MSSRPEEGDEDVRAGGRTGTPWGQGSTGSLFNLNDVKVNWVFSRWKAVSLGKL